MARNTFKDRERAFEAVYFAKHDAELIEKMHQQRAAEEARKDLAQETGITDEAALDKLLEVGVTSQNLQALSLAPLVCVAWADGELDPEERTAALAALEAAGVAEGSTGHQLFDSWLSRAPEANLLAAWKDYVSGLFEELEAPAREAIGKDLLARAESVAKAAGGFAGIGSISKSERAVLDEIESALTGSGAASD